MADYIDRLRETINNLSDIAREMSENAQDRARDFTENATERAREFTENASEKAREYAGAAAERARDFSDNANERTRNFTDGEPMKDLADKARRMSANARIAFEANGVNEDLKKAYMEIGKLYYEHAEAEEGSYFEPLFRKVRQLNEKLDELNAKLSQEEPEPEPETVIAEEATAETPEEK